MRCKAVPYAPFLKDAFFCWILNPIRVQLCFLADVFCNPDLSCKNIEAIWRMEFAGSVYSRCIAVLPTGLSRVNCMGTELKVCASLQIYSNYLSPNYV